MTMTQMESRRLFGDWRRQRRPGVARRAATYGASVAVVESGALGGTCVNVGCVPKKVMWNASEIADTLDHARGYGFDVEVRGHDFAGLRERREAYIERMRGFYDKHLTKDGVQLIRGRAQLVGPHEVRVGERTLSATHVLIATGSSPTFPDIPGVEARVELGRLLRAVGVAQARADRGRRLHRGGARGRAARLRE